MEPPRELLFDDGAAADADLVDDELARHDAEDELLAAFERDERPLARLDGRLADLAGRRVGVELLNGAAEEEQELVDRRRVRGRGAAGGAGLERRPSQAQLDGRRSDLSVRPSEM